MHTIQPTQRILTRRDLSLIVLMPVVWLLACDCTDAREPKSKAHICMLTSHREHAYVQDTSDALLKQMLLDGLETRLSLSIIMAGPDVQINSSLASPLEDRQLATGPDCATNEDTDPLPPCKVRQQGLDVAGSLESCYKTRTDADWVVLLEDDFMPCNNALVDLLAGLDALDITKNKFARFTQGGGGVAFPRENVLPYTKSVRENIDKKPCDAVLVEPWSDKPDFVFGAHLFKHVGQVSTIDYRNNPEYVSANSGIRDNTCGSPILV